jgi:hypothetical protein
LAHLTGVPRQALAFSSVPANCSAHRPSQLGLSPQRLTLVRHGGITVGETLRSPRLSGNTSRARPRRMVARGIHAPGVRLGGARRMRTDAAQLEWD